MIIWIWLCLHSGIHVQLACAGTTGQAVAASRCDGFAVVGDDLLPLWQATLVER